MIDDYIDEINRRLVATARQRARIVEDIRDHLTDAIEQLVAEGVDGPTAEQQAIGAFGSATDLAHQFNGHIAGVLLRRTPLVMVGSGFAVFAGFALAALSRPERSPASAGLLQQVAFFLGLLGVQFAFVAGARVVARVGARWRTVPSPADQQLIRRAGLVFSTGLAVAACSWTVALAAAADGQSSPRAVPLIAGTAVMTLAATVAWVITARRPVVDTGYASSVLDSSLFGVAERGIEWARRRPRTWCACVAILTAAAAAPHAETNAQGELMWAAIQAAAVIAGYVLLGPALELRATKPAHLISG